ncbi:DgkA [Balamuthia mandrillaris]
MTTKKKGKVPNLAELPQGPADGSAAADAPHDIPERGSQTDRGTGHSSGTKKQKKTKKTKTTTTTHRNRSLTTTAAPPSEASSSSSSSSSSTKGDKKKASSSQSKKKSLPRSQSFSEGTSDAAADPSASAASNTKGGEKRWHTSARVKLHSKKRGRKTISSSSSHEREGEEEEGELGATLSLRVGENGQTVTKKQKDKRLEEGDPLRDWIVFINVKSGGKQGAKLLSRFGAVLPDDQVYNLIVDKGPARGLERWKQSPDYRILVCGGDGTINWVLTAIDQMELPTRKKTNEENEDFEEEIKPCVGIVPLGTGNDLARTFGWGGSYGGERALPLLHSMQHTKVVKMDRWNIVCRPLPEQEVAEFEKQRLEKKKRKKQNRERRKLERKMRKAEEEEERRKQKEAGEKAKEAGQGKEEGAAEKEEKKDKKKDKKQESESEEDSSISSTDGDDDENEEEENEHKKEKHHKKAKGKEKEEEQEKGKEDKEEGESYSAILSCTPAKHKFIMNNYFSIGIDAEIVLGFHEMREKRGNLFQGVLLNKGWYAVNSARVAWQGHSRIRDILSIRFQQLQLADGDEKGEKKKAKREGEWKELEIPSSVRSIVIMNLPTYGGGNFWGKPKEGEVKEKGWKERSVADGFLEVIGLKGISHLGTITTGVANGGLRLAQASAIVLKNHTPLAAQVDGEPWTLIPCETRITHRNQATLLQRLDKSSSFD